MPQNGPLVAELSQADFARVARGGEILSGAGEKIEPIMGGISSVSRCAAREVHRRSPEAAVAYFDGKTANWALQGGRAAATVGAYRVSLERYIAWDGGSGSAEAFDLGTRMAPIIFAPGDSVRALAHIVRQDTAGREARILLWDDLSLDEGAAAMIALPVVERVNNVHGSGAASTVEVWQLAGGTRVSVRPHVAEAQRGAVRTLLAEV
jgi:hypothetical protein